LSKDIEYELLREIMAASMPVGASYLSLKLARPQATIGRLLQELEYSGYIVKLGNKGRILTESGRQHFDHLKNEYHIEGFAQDLVEIIASNSEQVFMEILQTRLLLEPYAIRLAVQKATDEQIGELEDIITKQLEKQNHDELGETENLEFHRAIVRLSGNSVIEQIVKIIMMQSNAYLYFPYLQYRVSLRENGHTAILDAIKERNAEKAEELMRRHLFALVKDYESIHLQENN